MFRVISTLWTRHKGAKNLRFGGNSWRVVNRRRQLENRRISEAQNYISPVEPSKREALQLYRNLLKKAKKSLQYTDKDYFRRQLRHEFSVTAAKTSGRVRGIMFEKGKWVLANDMGGIL